MAWALTTPPASVLWPAQCVSYKRVKGRSHTVKKRISMLPHKPHATSQPSRFSHTPIAVLTHGQHSAWRQGPTTGECKHKHVQRSCKASTHHEKLLKTEREEVWMYAGGRWVDGAMDRPLISKLAIDRVSTVQYTRSRLLCRISSGQSAATCN